MTAESGYVRIVLHVFRERYRAGATDVAFTRDDIEVAAVTLGVPRPKNLGDVIYAFKYRRALPVEIRDTATLGKEWVLVNRGRSRYAFEMRTRARIQPNTQLAVTKIPDATPGIVTRHALDDEQALLARLRYNRMLDIFTGVTCYSLQNHLRTTVPDMGQVETDEIYVGLDQKGRHYVLPVQAKGGSDELGAIQIEQDIALCRHKFPWLICRAIAAQFMADDIIALFEFELDEAAEVRIVVECHYRLVAPEDLTEEELRRYGHRRDRL